SSPKIPSSRTSHSCWAHHARKRSRCCSLVCCRACRWVETRTYRAMRRVHLLVGLDGRSQSRGSARGGRLTHGGPLQEQLLRLGPPTLPVGTGVRLATHAPLALHEALLAERSAAHSCSEGRSCGVNVPGARAAGAVTRLR